MEEIRLLLVHPDIGTLQSVADVLHAQRPHWCVCTAHTVELIESWLRVMRPDVVVVPARQHSTVRGLLTGQGLVQRSPPCLVAEDDLWQQSATDKAVSTLLLRLDLAVSSRSTWREVVTREFVGSR